LFRRQRAGRWRRSCPVGTCSPSARVLRRHVFSVGTCSPSTSFLALPSLFQHTHRLQPAPLALLFHSPHIHSATFPSAFSTRSLSQHVRSAPRRAPFWGVASSLRQSGADTPPSLSFSRHRDRSFFIRTWRMCCGFSLLHPTTVKPSSSWCGVLAGKLFADDEPRHGLRGQMSRHGACSLASAV